MQMALSIGAAGDNFKTILALQLVNTAGLFYLLDPGNILPITARPTINRKSRLPMNYFDNVVDRVMLGA